MFRNARHWVVKAHRPWRKRLLVGSLILALPLAAWALFDFGRYRAGFDSVEAERARLALAADNQTLRQASELLRQQVVTLEQAREIDRQAYAEVSEDLVSLQNEIHELKEEVAFYRGIVTPDKITSGVHVQRLQLSANNEPRGYSYKLVLAQMGGDVKSVKGRVKILVQGLLEQSPAEFTFDKLAGLDGEGYRFKFKYFDTAEGDIVLPEGFVPTRVMVEVNTESPKRGRIEVVYSWQELAG